MTGQVKLDSYRNAGIVVAIDLINALVIDDAPPLAAREAVSLLGRVLAIDPPSVAALRPQHVRGFTELACDLHHVFQSLQRRDLDSSADELNELLSRHSAHPHLAKEEGRWRLHHHPSDAPLLPMWTAICAESIASMIGADRANLLGLCEREGCGRAYVDLTKNASRRFCSATCQNRVKVAAFRERHRKASARASRQSSG